MFAAASIAYPRGTLKFDIPYQAPRAGAGRLSVELLDPEDRVLGRRARDIGATRCAWRTRSRWTTLFWHRRRYRYAYLTPDDPGNQNPLAWRLSSK